MADDQFHGRCQYAVGPAVQGPAGQREFRRKSLSVDTVTARMGMTPPSCCFAKAAASAAIRRWRGFRCVLLSLVFVLPTTTLAAQGGLFVLHSMRNASVDPALLKPDYIDGIACQIGWADVEPRQGQYDWSKIDEVIALARRNGKRVTIHLMPLRPPEWVYQSGVKTYTREIVNPVDRQFGQVAREYIPWDATFLRLWATLTQRFGARFSRDTTVFAISVTAPLPEIGRAVQQECRDRSRMPSSA
eukprot:TRINITY_DN17510_c0_g1_i35.p1 TRINITY_DN17510_c0_g1~~TRINITY_DN17510_c0_g1_i35.p1  ORF type:complete len:245 (-),score=36.77 TRINITY_DN17510_c0_g1_i35:27-761(-)